MDRFLVHRDPGSLPGEVIGPAAHEAANKRALERAALRSMMHAHLGVRAHRGIGRPHGAVPRGDDTDRATAALADSTPCRGSSLENCPDSHSSYYFCPGFRVDYKF